MELSLRGLGASASGSWCDPTDPIWCVICNNCITPGAAGSVTGSNPLPLPATVAPPTIDTNPASPTYGQAIINGVAVGTPAQAQTLVDSQIAAQALATNAAVQSTLTGQANAAAITASCNFFQLFNPTNVDCEFSIAAPGTLLAIVGVVLLIWGLKK
jgi:hypothetical protein